MALGPAAVGALLLTGWDWRTVAGLSMVPAILVLGLVLYVRPVGTRRPAAIAAPARRGGGLVTYGFASIFLVYAFSGVAYWDSLTFLPRFVGAGSFALLLGLGALGQIASGYLADRSRPEGILAGLSATAACLLVAFAAFPGAGPIAWAYGLCLFSLEPLQNTLVTREVPAHARGAAFGMTFLAVFGVGSGGAAFAGALLGSGLGGLLFVALAAFLGMSGAFAVAAGRWRKPGQAPPGTG